MRIRPAAVIGVTTALLTSLLSGCGLFTDNAQEQLKKILAATGNDITGMRVTFSKTKKVNVSVISVKDGKLVSTRLNNGKPITEDSQYPSFAAVGAVNSDKFLLDSHVALANELFDVNSCPAVVVTSLATPTGSTAAFAECLADPLTRVNERSTLDGESFFIPAIDPQSAENLDTLKQAYTKVLGTSAVNSLSYSFTDKTFAINGPTTTNPLGEQCSPVVTARSSESTTPFPVLCRVGAAAGSQPFDLNNFSTAAMAQVIAAVQNSDVLDKTSLGSITFRADGENLGWEVSTTNTGDVAGHRDLLRGTITAS